MAMTRQDNRWARHAGHARERAGRRGGARLPWTWTRHGLGSVAFARPPCPGQEPDDEEGVKRPSARAVTASRRLLGAGGRQPLATTEFQEPN